MEKFSLKATSVCTCLLLTLLVVMPVSADNSAMLELLKVLRDNGTLDDNAYGSLRAVASKEAASCARTETAAPGTSDKPAPRAAVTPEPGPAKQHSKPLVSMKTGTVQVNVGGRIQFDTAAYNDAGGIDFGSGAETRRARLEVDGKAGTDWSFRSTIEFADGADLKTAYFTYHGLQDNQLMFGKHREPILLDEITSSKYTTFMERAMITELHPGRNPGFGWRYQGEQIYSQAGVFFTDVDEAQDDQIGLTARAVWRPFNEKHKVLHLGLAGTTRDTPPEGELRFRARPESHVTNVRLIDTDVLVGINRHDMIGLEAAWINGPFSIQAEYLNSWLRRDTMPTLHFGGWYAYASWFVTGESRPYRMDRAAFGRLKPKRPLGRGGYGAWELAARFSHLDLTDQEVVGGTQDNVTFGINWYPTGNTRFSFNFVKVLEVDRPGADSDGVEPSILQVRAQLHF